MTRPTLLNYVTCEFGTRGSWAAGYHTGIDYRAAVGDEIFAAKKGRVKHAGWGGYGPAYGIHVIIESSHNFTKVRHLYAHLSVANVKAGDKVTAGTVIGKGGVTGNVTGPHLHFEERISPYGYYNHRRPQLPAWQPAADRLKVVLKKIGVIK